MPYANVEEVLARVSGVIEFRDEEITDVNQTGFFGNTPLAVVITWGDYEAASLLIEAGADVNKRVEDKETALHRAASFDHPAIVELLLANGARTDMLDNDGFSPLDYAEMHGYQSIIELLNQ